MLSYKSRTITRRVVSLFRPTLREIVLYSFQLYLRCNEFTSNKDFNLFSFGNLKRKKSWMDPKLSIILQAVRDYINQLNSDYMSEYYPKETLLNITNQYFSSQTFFIYANFLMFWIEILYLLCIKIILEKIHIIFFFFFFL